MILKKIYHWKLITIYIVCLISCKVGQSILDAKSKDIYVITVSDKRTSLLFPTIRQGKVFIQTRGWGTADFVPKFKRGIILINQKDTMHLFCLCKRLENYHFRNIDFKKGTFFIKKIKPFVEQIGKQLHLPRTVQNILFHNTLVHEKSYGYDSKNILLKDVKFKVIDFSEQENFQLIPISKEEFWDRNFTPESLKN